MKDYTLGTIFFFGVNGSAGHHMHAPRGRQRDHEVYERASAMLREQHPSWLMKAKHPDRRIKTVGVDGGLCPCQDTQTEGQVRLTYIDGATIFAYWDRRGPDHRGNCNTGFWFFDEHPTYEQALTRITAVYGDILSRFPEGLKHFDTEDFRTGEIYGGEPPKAPSLPAEKITKIICIVRGLLFIGSEILMVRKRAGQGSIIDGEWHLPGGKLNPGEDWWSGIEREVFEETGIEVKATHVLGQTDTHIDGDTLYIGLYFGLKTVAEVDIKSDWVQSHAKSGEIDGIDTFGIHRFIEVMGPVSRGFLPKDCLERWRKHER